MRQIFVVLAALAIHFSAAQVIVQSVSSLTQCLSTDGITCGSSQLKSVVTIDITFGFTGGSQLNVQLSNHGAFSTNASIQFSLPYFAVEYFTSSHPTAPFSPLSYSCGYTSEAILNTNGFSRSASCGCQGYAIDPFVAPTSTEPCESGTDTFQAVTPTCYAFTQQNSPSAVAAPYPGPLPGTPTPDAMPFDIVNGLPNGIHLQCYYLHCGQCGFIAGSRDGDNVEDLLWFGPIMENRIVSSVGGIVAAYTLGVQITGDSGEVIGNASIRSLGSQTTNAIIGTFVSLTIASFNTINGAFAPTIGDGVLIRQVGYFEQANVFDGNPRTPTSSPVGWGNYPWAFVDAQHCYGIGSCQNGINPVHYFQLPTLHCGAAPCAWIPGIDPFCSIGGCLTNQQFMAANNAKLDPPYVPAGVAGWTNRWWLCGLGGGGAGTGPNLCYEAITSENAGITVILNMAATFINQEITVQPGKFNPTQPSQPCTLFASNVGGLTTSVCNTGTLFSSYTVTIDCSMTSYQVAGSGADVVSMAGGACANVEFPIQGASSISNSGQTCSLALYDASSALIDSSGATCVVLANTFSTPPPGLTTSAPGPPVTAGCAKGDILCNGLGLKFGFSKILSYILLACCICCCCLICIVVVFLLVSQAPTLLKMGNEFPATKPATFMQLPLSLTTRRARLAASNKNTALAFYGAMDVKPRVAKPLVAAQMR